MEPEIETWRPLTSEEQESWENLSSQDKETCNALGQQLHRKLGHSNTRRKVDSLRQRKVHPTILAAAKLMKCDASQACARLSRRPVVSGRFAERGAVLQMSNFYWKHPTVEIQTQGILLVDMASRVTVVRIWKTFPRAESLGNVSSVEAKNEYYGRPMTVMTAPEGCFREQLFRAWLASKNGSTAGPSGVADWSSGQSVGCHQKICHASCTTCTSRHFM